jgi:hypothetical protein
LEEMRSLSGIIKLKGPVPSRKFLDADDKECDVDARD